MDRQRKAIVCACKGEHSLSVITVEAYGVTLSDIDIRGPGNSKQGSNDAIPAVLILAEDVEVAGCRITGKCSLGIKTYEMRTTVSSCEYISIILFSFFLGVFGKLVP